MRRCSREASRRPTSAMRRLSQATTTLQSRRNTRTSRENKQPRRTTWRSQLPLGLRDRVFTEGLPIVRELGGSVGVGSVGVGAVGVGSVALWAWALWAAPRGHARASRRRAPVAGEAPLSTTPYRRGFSREARDSARRGTCTPWAAVGGKYSREVTRVDCLERVGLRATVTIRVTLCWTAHPTRECGVLAMMDVLTYLLTYVRTCVRTYRSRRS